jgi:serine/threonine-protein kinase
LAKDPTQRPPDAGAFLAELEGAAERTYGPAWLERASIAGLVASAAAGGAATTVAAGGGGGGGGGAAPTVVFSEAPPPPAGGPAPQTPLVPRRTSGLKWAIAGTAAAVLVAGVVAVALASGDDDPNNGPDTAAQVADKRESPEPSAEPEPRPEETQPAGRYRGTLRFTRIVPGNGSVDASVREPENRVWTFEPTECTSKSCRGKVTSSTGASFGYTWDGRAVAIKPDVSPVTAGCTFQDGSSAPGTLHARLRTTYELKVAGQGDAVDRFELALTTTVLSYRDDTANNCTWNRPVPKFWVKSGTLRKIG